MSSSESEAMSSSESEESTSSGIVLTATGGPLLKTWIVCATCGWAEWERPDVYERENEVILLCRWCFRVPAPPHSWGAICNAEHFLRRMKLLPNSLQHVAVTDLIAVYLAAQDFGITYCLDEGIINGRWAHTSVFEIGLSGFLPLALQTPTPGARIVVDATLGVASSSGAFTINQVLADSMTSFGTTSTTWA